MATNVLLSDEMLLWRNVKHPTSHGNLKISSCAVVWKSWGTSISVKLPLGQTLQKDAHSEACHYNILLTNTTTENLRKIPRKMQRKGFTLCTHTKRSTLGLNNKSIYSTCLGALVTVWLRVCTNWCKWRVSSGCTVRLPHCSPLIAFISTNRYLLAHQPTPHRPGLVHLYGFLSKTKASIDSLPLVKPLCGTGMVTTVVWINILARELQGDMFKIVMTN